MSQKGKRKADSFQGKTDQLVKPITIVTMDKKIHHSLAMQLHVEATISKYPAKMTVN